MNAPGGAGPAGDDPHLNAVRSSRRYELHAELGRGASGVVYDVFDGKRGERVALKIAHRSGRRTQRQIDLEVAAGGGLDHPGLVRIHDHGLLDDYPYYTMERVVGPDLLGYLRPDDSRLFDEARLRDSLAQLVRALGALDFTGSGWSVQRVSMGPAIVVAVILVLLATPGGRPRPFAKTAQQCDDLVV